MSARFLLGLGAGALVTAGVVAAAADHRRLVRRATTAERRTVTDPLTGLSNRDGMDAGLARITTTRQSYALVMVDLDGFKPVNDTHGHDAGDLVLVEVGRRLERLVDADAVVARLGGDEFALVAPSPGPAITAGLGHEVVAVLSQPFGIGGDSTVRIGASVGVVHASSGEPTAAVKHTADAAMYRAKATGGGRLVEHDPTAALLTPGTNAPVARLRDLKDLARAGWGVAA